MGLYGDWDSGKSPFPENRKYGTFEAKHPYF